MKRLLLGAVLSIAATAAVADDKLLVLHRFHGPDGLDPQAALTLGPDGKFYGTTLLGGTTDRGTIFRFDPVTAAFTTIHNFIEEEGSQPIDRLLLASDGYFYGTTRYGGTDDFNCVDGCGMIYRILPSGEKFSVQHFMTFTQGTTLQGGLIEGKDGRLYGTASLGGPTTCQDSQARCGTAYAFSPKTKGVTVLHPFHFTDGRGPIGRLLQASNGFLYGVTASGATSERGVVYRLKPDGTKFEVLIEFANTNAGCQPTSGLINGSDGKLYGAAIDCGAHGAGTLYSLTLDGAIAPIYHFNADGKLGDGSGPAAELLEIDGKLYGTAKFGGLPADNPNRNGTLYRVGLDGTGFELLHTFFGLTDDNRISKLGYQDGGQPTTGVTLGPDGNIYGTAPVGGSPPWPGKGVVYKFRLSR